MSILLTKYQEKKITSKLKQGFLEVSLKEGRLKLRPINKPIHKPSKNDNIAKIPKEWQNELNFSRSILK